MNFKNPVKTVEKPQNLSLDLIDLEVESVWVFKTLAKTKPPQRRCLPLATVDKEIDEVRYILSDAFGTQKAVKIGFHYGKLKIHLRNYKKFTNKSEWVTRSTGSISSSIKFVELNIFQISDAETQRKSVPQLGQGLPEWTTASTWSPCSLELSALHTPSQEKQATATAATA